MTYGHNSWDDAVLEGMEQVLHDVEVNYLQYWKDRFKVRRNPTICGKLKAWTLMR